MNTMRPGISNKMLERAGIRHMQPDEARKFCGINESGIWIPYHNWERAQLRNESGQDLGRLLVSGGESGATYYDSPSTSSHAFLPPNINQQPPNCDLILCDGEFSALCLSDFGATAIGIQGAWGFLGQDRSPVPEIMIAIRQLQPSRLLLLGNGDSILDYEFSKASVALRAKLGGQHDLFNSEVLPNQSRFSFVSSKPPLC